ncbi:50S ribosomal protein L4 [Roseospira navarrensis]|uniref:Large ribosomal subunit protein uL4 n=1 Tax=Roseospira navarrensis TaxID=140058 RepID=A0A7X2D3C1_9PROT|nr:50S ribosomal protein L4 [Roseospira navarrensis]MQX37224.1 50S ribosomal protein L4 [Roseospira navarrensis]
MKHDVITLDNQPAGSVELDEAVFGLEVRTDILHRVVRWQMARRQAGTHKTKGISEIAGTTAKPFKQKGTGRARQGSKRATQWRGGATVFGPVVRSHAHDLPKKVRKLGLKTALSAKVRDNKLVVLDAAASETGKTKDLAQQLATLGWGNALVIDGPDLNEGFARAARNIVGLDVLPQQGANVRDILRRDTLVLTKDAVAHLQERLK